MPRQAIHWDKYFPRIYTPRQSLPSDPAPYGRKVRVNGKPAEFSKQYGPVYIRQQALRRIRRGCAPCWGRPTDKPGDRGVRLYRPGEAE